VRKGLRCCAGHDLSDPSSRWMRKDGYEECKACRRAAAARLRDRRRAAGLKTCHGKSGNPRRCRGRRSHSCDDEDPAILERHLNAAISYESLPRHLRPQPPEDPDHRRLR
jgi:hypothetical protein